MKSLNKITEDLYSDCLEIEKNIVLGKENNSLYWAKSNAKRHSYSLNEIINYIRNKNSKEFNILNASGIAAGQTDFPILTYLKNNFDFIFNWYVIDSPNNEYYTNLFFKKKLNELSINLKLIDFNKSYDLTKEFDIKFDIILFTEIAEHLDYSSLLNTLKQLSQIINDNGVLIFTSPNLLCLGYRFRMFFGSTKGMYWGDGYENLSKGLFGHITYYSFKRMERILQDTNIKVLKSFTFDYGYRKGIISKIKWFIKNNLLGSFSNNLNNQLFISAQKSDNLPKIPFKI